MTAVRGVLHDVLIVTCAISAGVHAALAPGHLAEGAGPGAGFVVATLLLGALVVLLTCRPAARVAVAGAGAVLAGLLVSYALATTTGLPLLHPDAEPVDGLALATKAVEAIGLVAALQLLGRGSRSRAAAPAFQPKGRPA